MPFFSLDERSSAPKDIRVSRGDLDLPQGQGVFLIGVFLGILLYGLSVHQAYRYICSFPTDAAYIRLLVILVMILETLHVLANMHTNFHYLISSHSDPENLKHVVWSLAALPVISGLVVVVSQIFFVRRVSLIGPRQRVMAKVVGIALIAELGFAIAATAISFTREKKKGTTVSVFTGGALVIAALADTTLTVALVQAFRLQRAREPRISEPIIDVIQLYVINSGIATGVFNFVSFILAISHPSGSLLYAAFSIITVRLYANSLLAVLNSRELRGMEFFLSASFASVTLEGAQFADKSALWNVPRAPLRPPPRMAVSGGEKPEFTNPWEKGGYRGFGGV